jgi:hypothetical protein
VAIDVLCFTAFSFLSGVYRGMFPRG